jgi:hypothetical protein
LKRSVSEDAMMNGNVPDEPVSVPSSVVDHIEDTGDVRQPRQAHYHDVASRDVSSCLETKVKSSSSSRNNNTDAGINSELRPADILMGRGTGPNQHSGNVRFRALVYETFAKYMEALGISMDDSNSSTVPTASGTNCVPIDAITKKKLAYKVLSKIKEVKGRFLQKLTKHEAANACSSSFPKDGSTSIAIVDNIVNEHHSNGIYVEVSDRLAIEKIKQTYRFLYEQKSGNRRRQSLPTPPAMSPMQEAARREQDDPFRASQSDEAQLPVATTLTPPAMDGIKRISHLLQNLQQPRPNHFSSLQSFGYQPRCHPSSSSLRRFSVGVAPQLWLVEDTITMALRVAQEEVAVTSILTRLVHLREAERENRKQLLWTELAKADVDRAAFIARRLQALQEMRNLRESASSISSSMLIHPLRRSSETGRSLF